MDKAEPKNIQKYHIKFVNTYSVNAAEKSCVVKLIPALYFVKEEDAVSSPTSPPRARPLSPITAESSNKGDGFRPILEQMAAR